MKKYISISKEVQSALSKKTPIVALESTIISHGMPYPQNFDTAVQLEKIVRKNDCVPATIAIINGIIRIGLSKPELEFLSKEKNIFKTSRRDIPYIVSQKLNGATTVSAAMICASIAGIKILATGGIGGVHRNGQNTLDISADLTELARKNIAVISSGVKSILDIGLTLEYLETMGIPIIGFKTGEFPAFYTSRSGFKVDFRIDSAKEIADIIKTKWELGLDGGIIIANPVPEKFSMDEKKINKAINDALKKSELIGVKGKDITPFLLSEIKNITDGLSLESNIQLVLNNAKLASGISKYLY